MSIIFTLLIILGAIFLIVMVLGYFLPDSWTVEKAILVHAETEIIFPYVNNIKSWQEWSVWNSENDLNIFYGSEESGKDSFFSWKGDQLNGKLLITDSQENNSINFIINLEQGNFKISGLIVLGTTMPDYTQVAWRSELKMSKSFNPVSKYQAYFLKNYFDSIMNESLKGLQSLFGAEESEIIGPDEL